MLFSGNLDTHAHTLHVVCLAHRLLVSFIKQHSHFSMY